MIIKNIARLCKNRRQIHLCEDPINACQWIGDGRSLYQLHEMPTLDEDTVFAVLDVPENKREMYTVKHTAWPNTFDAHDSCGEKMMPTAKAGIVWKGQALTQARTSLGLMFYDRAYLRPFSDLDEYEIWERETSDGQIYLAVKTGFFLRGIIVPTLPDPEDLNDELSQLVKELKTTISYRKMMKKEEQS